MNTIDKSLKFYNTFSVPCIAKQFVSIDDKSHLSQLIEQFETEIQREKFYILGDGSNTLFVNNSVNLIIKCNLKGLEFKEVDDFYYVKAAAGENWHQLILSCLGKDVFGLENLALIPGSVGAAPVQNIGAYGAEISNFCDEVEWFDFTTGHFIQLSAKACKFGYRDSIFKHALKNKGMITSVTFKLPKCWQPTLTYQGLSDLPKDTTAVHIMNTVVKLRKSKLPDPTKLPNAGSFFKNPIVNANEFEILQKLYGELPSYPQSDGTIKLAAGWLIEKAGLKGKVHLTARVHNQQALVLVNEFYGSGQGIANLAKLVTDTVYNKFKIVLEPEVRFINTDGECDSIEYIKNLQ